MDHLSARPPFFNRALWHFLMLVAALVPAAAWAHNPISSWAILEVKGDRMELTVEMATESAWLFLGETLDRPPNLEGSMPKLRSAVQNVYRLSVNGQTLQAAETTATIEDDAAILRLVYPRPSSTHLHCEALYLERLPADHHSTLTLLEEQKTLRTELLDRSKRAIDLELPARVAGVPSSRDLENTPRSKSPQATVSFGEFLKLGIEHILTGYDHLLFLLGLLIACRRWSSMFTIITCFTLAHSVTLALAALDIISIPARITEPLIAASIVFVGIENIWRREEPKGRWLLTFLFGLIHGFGFAGALRQAGLGGRDSSVALPLFSFNLGVETGQLAVVAVLFPLLWKLRSQPWFLRRGQVAISLMIAVLGTYWLLQRTLLW